MSKKILIPVLFVLLFAVSVSAQTTDQADCNVITPDGSTDIWGDSYPLDFNVLTGADIFDNNGYISAYLSTQAGAFTTKIADYNLFETGRCDSTDFETTAKDCQFNLDTRNYADGNYYLDLNLFDVPRGLVRGDNNCSSVLSFNISNSRDTYDIATDADINSYTTEDMKDISKAGIGTAGREGASWIELIIAVIIVTFAIGGMALIVLKIKKMV